MSGRVDQTCQVCGSNIGFTISDDGFFYCGYCNSQADDIIDTGLDEENFMSHYSTQRTRTVRTSQAIAAEPISQVRSSQVQYLDHPEIPEGCMEDGFGPNGPSDFGSSQENLSYDDYYSLIRSRYLTGFQVMIQMQCQALVEKFNVSPLIVGLVGPVWLRFVASTRILANEWADKAVHDSETQTQGGDEEFQPSSQYREEPVNILGRRVVMIWFRSLKSTIPISYSLAITFLVCHLAREPILPPDIVKWILEGNLPYFSAFVEIEKQIGSHSKACPISVSRMFRPIQAISSQKLESMAADIANRIGLELPAVNFNAIASRYCKQLSLPTKEILPMANRVCQWSMPSELYLSSNELKIPTRACVMSILIVAIRILFDINGYGKWESSFDMVDKADREPSSLKDVVEGRGTESDLDSRLDVVELLKILEKYNELNDVYSYSCDLPSYLQYCKDVIFSGLRPSFEDLEEEKLMEEFWEFYENNKDVGTSNHHGVNIPGSQSSALNDNGNFNESSPQKGERKQSYSQDSHKSANQSQPSTESCKDKAIRELKLDMEENKFCYIPPRVKVKRRDYLHYIRKRKEVYVYAVHADYYILLRSCAKVARVETRIMHIACLTFEKRLKWLENRMECSLNFNLNVNDLGDFCNDDVMQNARDESVEFNI